MPSPILVADVGGTKVDLALYDGGLERRRARFASRAYPRLEAIVQEFLAGERVAAAAFAVAGPVHAGVSRLTNLPWELREVALSAALGAKASLLNDLEACVLGIDRLPPEALVWLAPGQLEPTAPIAAIGAGTGLGEAFGVRTAHGLRAFAGEGGHADFCARDETEIELLRFLRAKYGRASLERALSGPGLAAIYEFVVERGLAPADAAVAAEMRAGDAGEVIGRRGSAGSCAACERALSIFIAIYGAEAGNLALKLVPRGGLYLVGGIAHKLLERLQRGDFMEAMRDKDRMRELLAEIPVAVVISPDVALLGARAHLDVV